MQFHEGILLGIIQGLTEFLPVSSSGHLVLGQLFFGYTESQLMFDISVHVGTLLAVIVVYFKDIMAILASLARLPGGLSAGSPFSDQVRNDPGLQMAVMIIIGSVPTAIIGLGLKKIEHILFTSSLLVSLMLLVTGTLLWVSRHYYHIKAHPVKGFGIREAVGVGIVQGMAVIPGISRSGSTIAAGMFLGMDRATAARFSFLLSIPAIIGAEAMGIAEMIHKGGTLDAVTFWATLASFVTGLVALKILIRLVHSGRFHLFAPYCWLVGAVVFIFSIV